MFVDNAELNVGTNYRDWIKRMIGYGFSEGIDYVVVTEKVDAQKRARTYEQQNHHIQRSQKKTG